MSPPAVSTLCVPVCRVVASLKYPLLPCFIEEESESWVGVNHLFMPTLEPPAKLDLCVHSALQGLGPLHARVRPRQFMELKMR